MIGDTSAAVSPKRVALLTQREERRLNEETPHSAALYARARKVMPGGVPSSYQGRNPWPIYVERGAASAIWDVDGRQYVDFHNGFGAMIQGHAHPATTRAIAARLRDGTHFAAPTEDSVWVAEELARRFGLPQWRFTNSGTEATMDAIRIARAATGREHLLKIFGSYHGHHDYVMVSIALSADDLHLSDENPSVPYGAGIPARVVPLTVAVPFNDADALERRIMQLEAEDRAPAALIMEAALMNMGVVFPRPGYLEQVREITRRHGIVWIVDEVKTGLTIAAGGATEYFGITPDMVTLAKALGGGLPSGAFGGSETLMGMVTSGHVYAVGTFNGNPLSMAAARASLSEILTAGAYRYLSSLNERLLKGCRGVLARYDLPGYALGINSKGVVMFARAEVVDFKTYKEHQNVPLTSLAWVFAANRGVFMTPGREEEWTLSVQHTPEDVDRYVTVFDDLAAELVG